MNALISLPIAAAPTTAPADIVDPIFAAIDAHKSAQGVLQATLAEAARADSVADAAIGPSKIEVPSMIEPGTVVSAACWWDIEQAIPNSMYPDQYAHFKELLDKRHAGRNAILDQILGDQDEFCEPAMSRELETLDSFTETTPTTLNGLLAMIVHAGEVASAEPEIFVRRPLLENMVAAAKALSRRQLS